MLSEEQIRDDGWREELNKRHSWMGGKYGLHFEHLGGWRFLMKDLLERIEATLVTPEERGGFQVSQSPASRVTSAVGAAGHRAGDGFRHAARSMRIGEADATVDSLRSPPRGLLD